jgi:hypothetical protein
MGKSRIGGIEALFRNTEVKPAAGPPASDPEKHSHPDKLVLINFQAPVSLKKKIHLYCVENDISLRKFITGLINEKLNDEKE